MFAERASSPQTAHVEKPVEEVVQMSAQEVVEELAVITARQTELFTRLKAQAVVEGSTIAQKDERIVLLEAQLAEAQAEVLAAAERTKNVTDEKVAVMAELQHERGEAQ